MYIVETDVYKELHSDDGKSLYLNKMYEDNETPHYFKITLIDNDATLQDCLSTYLEIPDSEIIINTQQYDN